MATEFGSVWVTDFDRGVVTTIGSVLVDIEIDSDIRQHYVLPCPGLSEYPDAQNLPEELRPLPTFPAGTVPVFFIYPEEVFQPWIIPCVVIRRSDITPNFDRAPWFGYQTKPSSSAKQIAVKINGEWVTGPDKMVVKWNPIPHDIAYEVQVYARLQYDELKLLHCVMKRTKPPWFTVHVLDDKGCVGGYDAGPVSISDLSELADVADRTIAHSISFEVRAELDLDDEFCTPGDGNDYGVLTSLPEVTYQMYRSPLKLHPDVTVPPDC